MNDSFNAFLTKHGFKPAASVAGDFSMDTAERRMALFEAELAGFLSAEEAPRAEDN